MTYNFQDKSVVVTGASRGIGRAIATQFAEAGARVFLVARNQEKLAATAGKLPNNAVAVAGDLSTEDGWNDIAQTILSQTDKIDALVNNAGAVSQEPLQKLTTKEVDRLLSINVRNLMMLTHALTPALISARGSVVNVSSVAAFGGMIGQNAYAASKGAINAFSRNAAFELGPQGVRVNAVAPGLVDGGMWKAAFAAGMDRDKIMKSMAHRIALEGRWASEGEIADVVLWLASSKSSYVTGQTIRVDGGMVM